MKNLLLSLALACIAVALFPGVASAQANTDLQRQAIFALSQRPDAESVPLLADLARTHANREVRKQAVFRLGQKHSADAVRALKTIADTDDDVEVQKLIVFALSQRSREEAVPLLIDVARTHETPEVRNLALFRLGQLGGDDVETFLREQLASDTLSINEQEQVVFAISQLPREEAVLLLIDVAKTHEQRAVRKQAVFRLGQSGDARAIEALLEIVQAN